MSVVHAASQWCYIPNISYTNRNLLIQADSYEMNVWHDHRYINIWVVWVDWVSVLPTCVGKISWRRVWQPTPVFLPGESHGQSYLEGYSSWGCKELDMTEQLSICHPRDLSVSLTYLGQSAYLPKQIYPHPNCMYPCLKKISLPSVRHQIT